MFLVSSHWQRESFQCHDCQNDAAPLGKVSAALLKLGWMSNAKSGLEIIAYCTSTVEEFGALQLQENKSDQKRIICK